MCGICGFLADDLDFDKRRKLLRGMSVLISHRGPDDHGYFEKDNVSLAHRRLSIIDKAGGHQPMTDVQGNLTIIYNGEVYNFHELRQDFSERGYRFQTDSDTEVILAGYMLIGEEIFQKINGMFALAIWDKAKKKLVLARDRLGIKPLYYTIIGKNIYFASEIKSIQYATTQRTLNEESFSLYMSYGYVPQNKTLIEGIKCLTPGNFLVVQDEKIIQKKFWSHRYKQRRAICDIREYLGEFEEKLRLSVKRRMISDVDFGAFLSGGVDSSLIVALMAQNSESSIKTFSIGFQEEGGNEFQYSRMVAKQFQTEHTEVLFTEDKFLDLLSEAVWYQDEPLRHIAAVPLLHLSREAKQKATVILAGEGADELFLGYQKYVQAGQVSTIAHFLPFFCQDFLYRRYSQELPRYVFKHMFKNDFELLRHNGLLSEFRQSEAPTWVEKIADVDCRNYLISLLMKQDKMSMAAAIESRVPFLDHELVEWGHDLPLSFKLRGQIGKYLVKRLAANFFPPEFLHRTKMGFPVPLDRWMSGGKLRVLMKEVFSSSSFVQRGYFDAKKVFKQIEKFPELTNKRLFNTRSYQQLLLWRIFNFEVWAKLFLDTNMENNLQ